MVEEELGPVGDDALVVDIVEGKQPHPGHATPRGLVQLLGGDVLADEDHLVQHAHGHHCHRDQGVAHHHHRDGRAREQKFN